MTTLPSVYDTSSVLHVVAVHVLLGCLFRGYKGLHACYRALGAAKEADDKTVELDSAQEILPSIPPSELTVIGTLGGGMYTSVAKGIYQGQNVAIKTYTHVLTPRSFSRQAQALHRLRSPYLVSLIGGAHAESSRPQLIFEFMDRGNLKDNLLQPSMTGRLPPVSVALAVAKGLATLHDHGVVHRDVCTRNVLLASDGGIKLADFGFARENAPLHDITPERTRARGLPLPLHMYWVAPEALHTVDAGTATDIYAFGVILMELRGCQTHHGNRAAFIDAMLHLQAGTSTALPLDAACDAWYEDLVRRCVALAPAMRPTAAEIVSILESQVEPYGLL